MILKWILNNKITLNLSKIYAPSDSLILKSEYDVKISALETENSIL